MTESLPGSVSACVMVVDDDEDIQEALSMVLSDLGYEVASASNGQKALDLLEALSAAPALIILDMMMPVMNGWQFLEHREKDSALLAIPVVVMTAAVNATFDATNLVAVLKKPVAYKQLKELLVRCTKVPS